MKYRVIYTWRGERHWGNDHATIEEAKVEVAAFHKMLWHAWVEEI